jgi:hypothetical protein
MYYKWSKEIVTAKIKTNKTKTTKQNKTKTIDNK